MTITQQTTNEIQNTLSKSYKSIKFDLDSDNSLASRALSLAINGYLNLEIASFADLVNLREAIYIYQNQLDGQIKLHQVAEILLLNVKSFIDDEQIGYTFLENPFAKTIIRYVTETRVRDTIETLTRDFSTILSTIQNYVAALSDSSLNNNGIATMIAYAVSDDDTSLIDELEADLTSSNLSPSEIQTNIASISGDDGDSITLSLYNALGISNLSSDQTALDLSANITAYDGTSYNATVRSTYNVSVPVFEQTTAYYVITDVIGSNPIGPQSEIYLNKCTLEDDIYIVGSSVFAGFDSNNEGLILSAMEGLNSLTGQIAAISQCSTWARSEEDLYASTTYPMATTGDATATGCSPLMSSGDAMILCHSVFDMMS